MILLNFWNYFFYWSGIALWAFIIWHLVGFLLILLAVMNIPNEIDDAEKSVLEFYK